MTRISFGRPKVSFSPTDETQDYVPEIPFTASTYNPDVCVCFYLLYNNVDISLGQREEHVARAFVPGLKRPMDDVKCVPNGIIRGDICFFPLE